jgi:hypothetical protein
MMIDENQYIFIVLKVDFPKATLSYPGIYNERYSKELFLRQFYQLNHLLVIVFLALCVCPFLALSQLCICSFYLLRISVKINTAKHSNVALSTHWVLISVNFDTNMEIRYE